MNKAITAVGLLLSLIASGANASDATSAVRVERPPKGQKPGPTPNIFRICDIEAKPAIVVEDVLSKDFRISIPLSGHPLDLLMSATGDEEVPANICNVDLCKQVGVKVGLVQPTKSDPGEIWHGYFSIEAEHLMTWEFDTAVKDRRTDSCGVAVN